MVGVGGTKTTVTIGKPQGKLILSIIIQIQAALDAIVSEFLILMVM